MITLTTAAATTTISAATPTNATTNTTTITTTTVVFSSESSHLLDPCSASPRGNWRHWFVVDWDFGCWMNLLSSYCFNHCWRSEFVILVFCAMLFFFCNYYWNFVNYYSKFQFDVTFNKISVWYMHVVFTVGWGVHQSSAEFQAGRKSINLYGRLRWMNQRTFTVCPKKNQRLIENLST